MKPGRAFWLFIGLLVVLHFLLHLSLGIGAWAPDLLTLAVLLSARRVTAGVATGVGFTLGLLGDAVASAGAFGAATLTEAVLGFVGARSQDLLVGDGVLFVSLYLLFGAWLQDALYYAIAPTVRRGEPVVALLVQAPLEAAYVAAVGTVAVLMYEAVRRP